MFSNLSGDEDFITWFNLTGLRPAQQAPDPGGVDIDFPSLSLGNNFGITRYDFY